MKRHAGAIRHLGTRALPIHVLLIACANAFQATTAFEVASVKMSRTGGLVGSFGIAPGGRVSIRNTPLKSIISRAFNLEFSRLRGGPRWIETEAYDIEAKPAQAVDGNRARLMLQRLLADRFNLEVHNETAVAPGYDLIVAKPGKMKASDATRSTAERTPGLIRGAATTGDLARMLRSLVNAPVEDRTALPGRFDIELKFDSSSQPFALASTNDTGQLVQTDPTGTVFTALQQQLGLRLKPARISVDVIVIDRVERPTAN